MAGIPVACAAHGYPVTAQPATMQKRFLEKNEDMTNSIYDEERSKHLMSDQVRA
jgi:hypothetical protein